jgi:hypothetical protein
MRHPLVTRQCQIRLCSACRMASCYRFNMSGKMTFLHSRSRRCSPRRSTPAW